MACLGSTDNVVGVYPGDETLKIFGIGLNKTGTQSLHYALLQLGYNSQHWLPANFDLFARGRFDELLSIAEGFDCLSDWPWPLMMDQLLDHYGDKAKYILTTRRDSVAWLNSIKNHANRHDDDAARSIRTRIFGFASPVGVEEHYLELYEQHNRSVRDYFVKQGLTDHLLDVSWDKGDGWHELCDFLDVSIPNVSFPHQNKSATLRRGSLLKRGNASMMRRVD